MTVVGLVAFTLFLLENLVEPLRATFTQRQWD
jgi:hypothetical protein